MHNIEQLYENIANKIVQHIDDEWSSAFIESQVMDGATKLKGGFTNDKGFTSFRFREFDRTIVNDFKDLYEISKQTAQTPWNHATFTIKPNGSFTIDLKYEEEEL